ncbi:hypothetical protein [Thermococcus sp.]
MRLDELFSVSLVTVATLSPAFSLSRYFEDFSKSIELKIGIHIAPIFLSLLTMLSLVLYLFYIRKLRPSWTVAVLAVFYAVPYLGGIPVKEIPSITLAAIPLGISIALVPYVEELRAQVHYLISAGVRSEEINAIVVEGFKTIGFALLPGVMLLTYLLLSTGAGSRPITLLPTFLIIPLALILGLILTSIEQDRDEAEETILVLRAYMVAGDTFRIRKGTLWEEGYELLIEGGSPVKRTVLISFPVSEVPKFVILRSPWDTKFLSGKMETIENGKRYLLFLETMSRAPSSPDSASAPP